MYALLDSLRHSDDTLWRWAGRIGGTLLVLLVSLGAWKLVGFAVRAIEARVTAEGADVQRARGIVTQAKVIGRVLHLAIVIVGGALVLVQYDVLRTVGLSLLASAGVAGIVLGVAAQRPIGALLAGLQLSFTQPVRVGDQIVIEGEFGTVEELTLSYAVVRLGDLRRLVVPVAYFLEKPFENWTRVDSALVGTVVLHVDFKAPIELLRREALAFIETHPCWNGEARALTVSEMGVRTLTLRVSASAADADRLGTLRNALREHLVTVLQDLDGGAYLPKDRIGHADDMPPAPLEGGDPFSRN
jgi:small-conductance mechanosensitive channel